MDISLIPVRDYASRGGAVNASGGRFIVSDRVRRHPNRFAMTSDDCLFCFACGAPGAIDLGLGGCPQSRLGSAAQWGQENFCVKLLKPIPSRGCWSRATWWDMISVAVKGPTAMQRSAHALVIGLLLRRALRGLGTTASLLNHVRIAASRPGLVFAQPAWAG